MCDARLRAWLEFDCTGATFSCKSGSIKCAMKSSHAKGLICIVCLPITWLHVCSSEKFFFPSLELIQKRVTVLEKKLATCVHMFLLCICITYRFAFFTCAIADYVVNFRHCIINWTVSLCRSLEKTILCVLS